MEPHILAIGSKQPPYNRTDDFSQLTHEILNGLEYVFQTKGKVALLTGSGTLAMEAAVINFLTPSDKVIVVNGGTFGQRWCDLCRVHAIPFHEIQLNAGEDLEAVGKVARELGLLFVVDAISTVCADPFPMDDWNVDIAILSTQKAIALAPGLSFVAMNPRSLSLLQDKTPRTLYLNLQDDLTNQERGQFPYTPAIGLLLQLHQRLSDIQQRTLPETIEGHRLRAVNFRKAIARLPYRILPARSSNAMTALICDGMDATQVVHHLQTRHAIEVAPSGGALKHKLIRISHMGDQSRSDEDAIIAALTEVASSIPNRKDTI
jgi:aspartate aminotransferase-like enzyme